MNIFLKMYVAFQLFMVFASYGIMVELWIDSGDFPICTPSRIYESTSVNWAIAILIYLGIWLIAPLIPITGLVLTIRNKLRS